MDRAWCVPLLASISTFLLTMPFTCFGLLFVLVMNKFGTTREQASWMESAFIMSSNLSALGIAFLQRRISLSNIAVMAAAITSAAVIASAFAPNVEWMSAIFGGAYGFAVKLFMASVSIYTMLFFDKYRATAQSFISCAQGAAGMAGQALLSSLEETYGFAGALAILGGILLHAVPLSMLLREAHRIRFTCSLKRNPSRLISNIVAIPAITCSNKNTFLHTCKPATVLEIEGNNEHKQEFAVVKSSVTGRNIYSHGFPYVGGNDSFHAEMYDKYSRKTSLKNSVSTRREQTFLSKAAQKTTMRSSEPEHSTCRVETIAPNQSCPLRLALSLLHEPAFYILVFAIVAGDYTEIVFLATAVEYGEDRVLTMEASERLVTVWFLGQFIGSGLLPVIADCTGYSRSSVYVVTFAFSSISLAALPHVMEIAGLSVVLAIHGMAMGFIRCVKCVVIADQVGTERTAACWGISGLAIIPLSLANPVIIGK
ncbi:monocarboxylate transporter 9 [Rhipicephalus sanguineus]|uniref:monocarboxylate transporter 9 n=1 Tax=Rhipicephalus sanguineus TaxID=34632 RepID=UPI0018944A7D|nr:monocarboxylate transporter 9 [Rhipicephalus sanguineus]